MSFRFQDFCERYGIQYATPGNKHVSHGWIGVPCPFCTGNPGFHLGVHEGGAVKCWRCGTHSQNAVVQKLLGVDWAEAQAIREAFGGEAPRYRRTTPALPQIRPQTLDYPRGTGEITDRHRRYLSDRGFSADDLIQTWGLKGTGPTGPYKHRIIVPINFKGRVVSYQGRDVTDRSSMKYKACAKDVEVIPHQSILYGIDGVHRRSVIVTEGVTDVWRLGRGNAVATFGIEYTPAQVNLIQSRFSLVFIMFDSTEEQARVQSGKLASELSMLDVEVEEIIIDQSDPGSMTEDEARVVVEELLG